MRTDKTERIRAEQVSDAIDQLLRDPGAQPEQIEPIDAGLLDTARRLAHMQAWLGPVDPVLEQQVMRQVRTGTAQRPRRFYLKPGWAGLALAAVLLAAMLLTPAGQTAVASFMAVFSLGRTEVRITPVSTPSALPVMAVAESTAVQQSLTLPEARARVDFSIPQPAYLPDGYLLREVNGYSYPDLPAWIPQPFFVELLYSDEAGHTCTLRVYPISLGEGASISGMNLEADPIEDVRNVDMNGRPGVLLRLGASPQRGAEAEATWREVVWEQGDLVLALYGANLPESELLRIARSVR
jgi:hypothetical protein